MRTSQLHKRLFALAVFSVFALGMMVGTADRAAGLDLGGIFGDVLKVGGIGLLVAQYSHQLNDAINGLMAQHGVAVQGMTKVVPIIRVGTEGNTQAGAAQVMGPAEQVQQVKAVAEVQLDIGSLRGRALIPIATKNPLKGQIETVPGVGVSANIKVRI